MSGFKRKIWLENQLHCIIAIGIIWGLLELFLGPLVKSFSKGLFGILMPFISAVFILSAKYWAPARGGIFFSAVIAASIKYLFGGMVLSGAFMAILIEALLLEIVFFIGAFSAGGYIVTGILIQLYSAFHPYLTKGLLCQSVHFIFFRKAVSDFFKMDLSQNGMLVLLLSTHLSAGLLAGFSAWLVVQWLYSRTA